jgi:hypothetical protein
MDIAEYGTRVVTFRDGRLVTDRPVKHRRSAAGEISQLPTAASEHEAEMQELVGAT